MDNRQAYKRAVAALRLANYQDKESGGSILADLSTGEIQDRFEDALAFEFKQGPKPYWYDDAKAARASAPRPKWITPGTNKTLTQLLKEKE